MPTRHTARGIVIHNNAILFIERWRLAPDGQALHYFAVPGGGLETGETAEAAVVREIMEETGVLVRPEKMLVIQRQHGAVHHYFLCQFLSGSDDLKPAKPEAPKPGNRYRPCWLSYADFTNLPKGEVHEFIQPIIAKLLAPGA